VVSVELHSNALRSVVLSTLCSVNNQSPLVGETIQAILTAIISKPIGDDWQNSPRRHQLITFLNDIGFAGVPESGLFTNAPKPKKIKLSQLACAVVEAIVS